MALGRCYHQGFLVCRGLSVYLLLSFSLYFVVRWGIFKISPHLECLDPQQQLF